MLVFADIPQGIDPTTFTHGKAYIAIHINANAWEIKDDKGSPRIILPDQPSAHLYQHTSSGDLRGQFVTKPTADLALHALSHLFGREHGNPWVATIWAYLEQQGA